MFLKNSNINSKIKRSKVTDYAALNKCETNFLTNLLFKDSYRYSYLVRVVISILLKCIQGNFRVGSGRKQNTAYADASACESRCTSH